MTAPNQHQRGTDAACGGQHAFMGGMRRLASVADDKAQDRPTLRGRAGIFDVMISQRTRLGLRAQPFSHSCIARHRLLQAGLSNRRLALPLLPERGATHSHAANEWHIGALSFRRSVQIVGR